MISVDSVRIAMVLGEHSYERIFHADRLGVLVRDGPDTFEILRGKQQRRHLKRGDIDTRHGMRPL